MWGDEDFHVGRCWRTEPAKGGGFALMTASFVRWPSGNVSTDCVSGLSVTRACQDPPNNRQRPIAPTVNRGTGFTIMSIHTYIHIVHVQAWNMESIRDKVDESEPQD